MFCTLTPKIPISGHERQLGPVAAKSVLLDLGMDSVVGKLVHTRQSSQNCVMLRQTESDKMPLCKLSSSSPNITARVSSSPLQGQTSTGLVDLDRLTGRAGGTAPGTVLCPFPGDAGEDAARALRGDAASSEGRSRGSESLSPDLYRFPPHFLNFSTCVLFHANVKEMTP